ncbi:MAG TPA: DinB family protein [Longimicrobiales bacterium]
MGAAVGLMRVERPYTRSEILESLVEVESEVAGFFESLPDRELVLRVDDAWTPAEHLQHLCTSVAAVARGFSMRRWLLRLRFGRARRPSATYAELRERYRDQLGRGARASGVFVPERVDAAGVQIAEHRAAILARWSRVNLRLRTHTASWSERDLDRIQLPHPLLGMLTAREMLFFTLYHNQHHVSAAEKRLPRYAPPSPGAD